MSRCDTFFLGCKCSLSLSLLYYHLPLELSLTNNQLTHTFWFLSFPTSIQSFAVSLPFQEVAPTEHGVRYVHVAWKGNIIVWIGHIRRSRLHILSEEMFHLPFHVLIFNMHSPSFTQQFAHGEEDLRRRSARHPKYKTQKCKAYWNQGFCPYGGRCMFLHDEPDNENVSRRHLTPPLFTFAISLFFAPDCLCSTLLCHVTSHRQMFIFIYVMYYRTRLTFLLNLYMLSYLANHSFSVHGIPRDASRCHEYLSKGNRRYKNDDPRELR